MFSLPQPLADDASMMPHPAGPAPPRQTLLVGLLAFWLAGYALAEAGHESPYHPSFYPQEITVQTMDPASAGAHLRDKSLHVYIGSDPFAGASPPGHVTSIESFGSYLVATLNTSSPTLRNTSHRCAAARVLVRALGEGQEAFVFSPHPVTPYHPDYLNHFDLAQTWKQGLPDPSRRGGGTEAARLRIKAHGKLAEKVVGGRWPPATSEWDAAVEEVDLLTLAPSPPAGVNGWSALPWLKQGWFHAYLLLAGSIQDRARRQRLSAIYRRLVDGAYADPVEQVNLERSLVGQLAEGCERVVVGYTTRRTFLNDDFSQGVENVAVDSQAGAIAPIFLRTAKLKDFPWNGGLRVGIEAKPGGAARSPIGGSTDPAARLVWYGVGDPAAFPAPADGTWVPNRVAATVTPSGSAAGRIEVPPDVLLPAPGTGRFSAVGVGRIAKAKVIYKVPASLFHDGTRVSVADLVYPFAFAARSTDRFIADATALPRQWLAGFKTLPAERVVKDLGAAKLEWQIPVIEVFLHHSSRDPQQAAVVAPPWSTVPWHLLTLMEEAVRRGAAAFSAQEAKSRGIPPLDLVRDPALQARMAALAEEFERGSHVPEPLKELVTPEEARQRWAALRQFAQKHHHLLITNGPYRLEKWTADAVTLQVFRDPSYPLGVGTFDAFVLPPKAHIVRIESRGASLLITAEMEAPIRAQRSYTWTRERLTRGATARNYPVQARCGYLVIGANGTVRRTGAAPQAADGTFHLDLKGLPAGGYSVLVAVTLNGNTVNPDVRAVKHRIER